MQIKNYGFIPPYIQEQEHVLGANTVLPDENLQWDGQWGAFLPLYEPQAEKYETWGCTIWGSENQVETYFKRRFGFEPNYDEGFIYNLAEVGEPGANPQDIYEIERKNGFINNRPIPDSYEEFSKRPVSDNFIAEGKKWLAEYKLRHSWIFYPTATLAYKQEQLIKNLVHSPIGVSVVAWRERNEKYWKNIGEPDTHWCLCIGYVLGEYWLIFDSYDHSIKKLEWGYDFGYAKRIYVEQLTGNKQKKSWLSKLWCK